MFVVLALHDKSGPWPWPWPCRSWPWPWPWPWLHHCRKLQSFLSPSLLHSPIPVRTSQLCVVRENSNDWATGPYRHNTRVTDGHTTTANTVLMCGTLEPRVTKFGVVIPLGSYNLGFVLGRDWKVEVHGRTAQVSVYLSLCLAALCFVDIH